MKSIEQIPQRAFALPPCDHCGEPITEIGHGMIRWRGDEGCSPGAPHCMIVHKSFASPARCDDAVTTQHGDASWEELGSILGKPATVAHVVERMVPIRRIGAPIEAWDRCLTALLSFDRIDHCACGGCHMDEAFAGATMGGRKVTGTGGRR